MINNFFLQGCVYLVLDVYSELSYLFFEYYIRYQNIEGVDEKEICLCVDSRVKIKVLFLG